MDKNLIKITIDNQEIMVPEGITILEASNMVNIDIPTLCFLKDINEVSDCRMCIVKVEGIEGFITSCTHKVKEGMIIKTHSPEIIEARRVILDLIISNHNKDCPNCTRLGNCELQALAAKFSIQVPEFQGKKNKSQIDDLSPSIVRDPSRCIVCRRCVETCEKIQGIGAIECKNKRI